MMSTYTILFVLLLPFASALPPPTASLTTSASSVKHLLASPSVSNVDVTTITVTSPHSNPGFTCIINPTIRSFPSTFLTTNGTTLTPSQLVTDIAVEFCNSILPDELADTDPAHIREQSCRKIELPYNLTSAGEGNSSEESKERKLGMNNVETHLMDRNSSCLVHFPVAPELSLLLFRPVFDNISALSLVTQSENTLNTNSSSISYPELLRQSQLAKFRSVLRGTCLSILTQAWNSCMSPSPQAEMVHVRNPIWQLSRQQDGSADDEEEVFDDSVVLVQQGDAFDREADENFGFDQVIGISILREGGRKDLTTEVTEEKQRMRRFVESQGTGKTSVERSDWYGTEYGEPRHFYLGHNYDF